MGAIADHTDNELWLLRSTLRERYGEDGAVQLAATETRLDPHSTQPHTCPAESRRIRDMDAGMTQQSEGSLKTYESQDTDRRE